MSSKLLKANLSKGETEMIWHENNDKLNNIKVCKQEQGARKQR